MHELGVVFHCIKEVNKIAAENGVSRVNSVTVEIGEVSTVLPDLFEDCWNWAVKKETVLKDAKVIIEIACKTIPPCNTARPAPIAAAARHTFSPATSSASNRSKSSTSESRRDRAPMPPKDGFSFSHGAVSSVSPSFLCTFTRLRRGAPLIAMSARSAPVGAG